MEAEADEPDEKKNKSRVKVAIRVRPMIAKEKIDGQRSCIDIRSGNEIILGGERSFKFDHVFKDTAAQAEIYQECIKDLIVGCFEGYNAAVLAYGQTGSGKTYTMGTACCGGSQQQDGIIPRVIEEIFAQKQLRKVKSRYEVHTSFIEIYNKEIIDLLAGSQHLPTSKNKDTSISVAEAKDGSIYITGVIKEEVRTPQDMLLMLQRGGVHRTTARTLMNETSSRSHAIFIVYIDQKLQESGDSSGKEQALTTAKFLFVDLAGSERVKKTGATGTRFYQGININQGLLQLGNIISALATIDKKQDQFIVFRNNILTRILQDSLGGNSNTYMIACVSPAESNYEESLNTVKYASKAMNIKNTPIINRDPISQLRQRIHQLETDNRKLKKMLNQKGVEVEDTIPGEADVSFEELRRAKDECRVTNRQLEACTIELAESKRKMNQLQIKNYELRRERDMLTLRVEGFVATHPEMKDLEDLLKKDGESSDKQNVATLEKYLAEIDCARMQLSNRNKQFDKLQCEFDRLAADAKKDELILVNKNKLIYTLFKENNRIKQRLEQLANQTKQQQSQSQQKQQQQQLNKQQQQQKQPQQSPSQTSEPSQHHQYSVHHQNNKSTMQHSQSHSHDQLTEEQEQELIMLDDSVMFSDVLMSSDVLIQDQYGQQSSQTKEEIVKMEREIAARQDELERMNYHQTKLQVEVIAEMKNQYSAKIALLEREMREIKASKQKEGGSNYSELEKDLKEYKRKEKEQKGMERKLNELNSTIHTKNEEIKAYQLLKTQLTTKLKDAQKAFEKKLKEANREKRKMDTCITKLTLDNLRKERVNKKKEDQLHRAKRANQALKALLKPANKKDTARDSAKELKENKEKPSDSQKQMERMLLGIMQRLLMEIDRSQSLQRCEAQMSQTEKELQHLLNQHSVSKLRLQRLRLRDEPTEQELAAKEELQVSLNDLKERISIVEDSLSFCQSNHQKILCENRDYFDIDSEVLLARPFESNDNLKCLLRLVFLQLKSLLAHNSQIKNQNEQKEIQVGTLTDKVSELRDQIMNLNTEYNNSLTKMREEIMLNRYMEEQEVTAVGTYKRMDEKERKNLENKVASLTKANRQINQEAEMWRRKCQIIQEKYQNVRIILTKDKSLARQMGQNQLQASTPTQALSQSLTLSQVQQLEQQQQQPLSQSMSLPQPVDESVSKTQDNGRRGEKSLVPRGAIHQLEEMMQGLDKLRSGKQTLETAMDQQTSDGNDETYPPNNNAWECTGRIDGHSSAILSMALHSNILITTATRSLKIWDLENMKIISDLSGPHLAGLVKFVLVDPERRLMFTACEKAITIWDLITLEVQGTLRSHKDEVRTVHGCGDYLFSGGKGLANSGSLLIWDLRKLNPNQALEEREKNQDIFTFASRDKVLYYGTRNHNVRRMSLTHNFEILTPFDPPHMDSVTGLAVVSKHLVSGSKDKNLRLWSLERSINNTLQTFQAFNDYVSALQSTPSGLFYAGARDGQLKVCLARQDRVDVLGNLLTHVQSVNAICPLEDNYSTFVTASSDRTIKIWQPTRETREALESTTRQT